MELNYKKTAIITGGSSGIGLATAEKFIHEEIRCFVLDKQACPLADHPLVHYTQCDVSSELSVRAAFEVILSKAERIDHLVLNAGIYHFGILTECTIEDMHQVIGTNLIGTLLCLKATLPMMVNQASGAIVITGSDQSLIGKKNNALYGATKAALGQLTKSTALDYAEYNIRVNCVCPGAIVTPLYHQAVKHSADKYFDGDINTIEQLVCQKHPLQRPGEPQEVANVIYFLCSEESSFMTGSVVFVDGGYTAQ